MFVFTFGFFEFFERRIKSFPSLPSSRPPHPFQSQSTFEPGGGRRGRRRGVERWERRKVLSLEIGGESDQRRERQKREREFNVFLFFKIARERVGSRGTIRYSDSSSSSSSSSARVPTLLMFGFYERERETERK